MRRLLALFALSFAQAGCPSSPEPPAPSASASAPAPVAPPPPPEGFAEVSAGGDFTCARLFDGTARCWGRNNNGQLGDGTLEDRPVPTPVAGLDDVAQIAAGERHACALKKNGAVLCWGDNSSEALGKDGANERAPNLVRIARDVTHIALGWSTTCVTHASELAGCWGDGMNAGNPTSREITFALPAPAGALFAGGRQACAVVAGQAHCWGPNDSVVLAPGQPRRLERATPAFSHVISIALRLGHACVVGEDHRVRCLGVNGWGQLGDGTKEARAAPVEVKGIDDAISVITFDITSCALRLGGTVSCWGANRNGELGDGSAAEQSLVPVQVAGLADVVSITGGSQHACALRRDHRLFCWGSNHSGELGLPSLRASPVPVDVAGVEGATALAAGGHRTCARLGDGSVTCFGAPPFKQAPPTPARVEGLAGVAEVAVQDEALCARTTDARVWCAGSPMQIPERAPEGSRGPRVIESLRGATRIAFGASHGCALLEGGAVSCWGENDWSQSGGRARWYDYEKPPPPPARVAGLTGVRALALGRVESCALDGAGKVRCWGAPTQSWDGIDDHPELRPPSHETPVALPLDHVTAIAHGLRHGCALLEDGTVSCWGRDDYGQLGDGRVGPPREAPAPVPGLTGVVEIAAGSFFGCARTREGKVWCWGDNYEGQLGDGTHADRTLPVAVQGLDGALGLALGHTHACALVAGGRVKCWGANLHRELGQGAPVESRVPLEVRP